MSLSERRIHLTVLKSSSPLLAQTSHPPTRNLFGKTHDAGDGGATAGGVDNGILNNDDQLHESMIKVSMATILGRDDNGADDGNDVDDAYVSLSMRQVIAMMVARLPRMSARAEVQETSQTDHARAAMRARGPRGTFCKGFVPWAHDRSIAGAPRD